MSRKERGGEETDRERVGQRLEIGSENERENITS